MIRQSKKDIAVSPVVGVLLMLVITIIIAAVVSGFAGGLAGTTSAPPQASISVKILDRDDGMKDVNKSIEFKLLSGDPIPTKDLAILTYYTNKTGYTYKHEQTVSTDLIDLYNGTAYTAGYYTRVPHLSNLGKGLAKDNSNHFGNFTWTVGDVMRTGTLAGTTALLNITDWNTYDLTTGSVVDIKIKHIPSNKFIYDKEVAVE